jgi:oxazoline/thiazoline synthase
MLATMPRARAVRRDRTREVLFLPDRTLVFQRDDRCGPLFVLRQPPPDAIARILTAAEGEPTLDELCDRLAAHYERDDVAAAVEALRGVILEPDRAPSPHAVAAGQLMMIGGGELARDLATRLSARGLRLQLLWAGAWPAPELEGVTVLTLDALEDSIRELRDLLAGATHVIAVHEATTLGRALAVNRAALAAGRTTIHVLASPAAITLGPTTVPFRTPCLECASVWRYFERHRADDAASALEALELPAIEDAELRQVLATAAADRIVAELAGLSAGTPYPRMLQAQIAISISHGTRELELQPTTQCASCHGCNPRGITRGLGKLPTPSPLDRSRTIADRAGGVRSVGPIEARRRIEAAMRGLGIEIVARSYRPRLLARYPALAELPFVEVVADRELRPGAPVHLGRLTPAFGKGVTLDQATCSGMFEFLERQMIGYRGGLEIVRAAWREVRDHAIDMDRFTEGFLDAPDGDGRVAFDGDAELDWIWGQCIETGRPLLVPAEAVFVYGRARRPMCGFRGGHMSLPWRGSSGASAGCTREDAVLQGLYEVLENDARNLQNRTGIRAPSIPVASIDDPSVTPLLRHLEAAGFDLTLRYLALDIAIPVVEAYLTSRRDLTFHRVPGYGCHHDPAIAVRRAITEAIHTLGVAEATRRQTLRDGDYSIVSSFHDTQYCVERVAGERAFSELPAPDPGWERITDYLDAAVASVKRAIPDAQLCFVDLPTFGLVDVVVVAVLINGAYDASFHSMLIPQRLREAASRDAGTFSIERLYLGELKS